MGFGFGPGPIAEALGGANIGGVNIFMGMGQTLENRHFMTTNYNFLLILLGFKVLKDF